MHPVFGKLLSVGCLRLCDFIFMMGEYQILTTRMNINFITQIFFAHNRAFNMPAGTSVAPGGLPVRLSLLLRLPKYKVKRILLLVFSSHKKGTVSSLQVIKILVRKLSVFLKASGSEIYGSILCRVSMPFFNQCSDHIQHTADFFGCLGMGGGRLNIHRRHVFFAFCNITFRDDRGIYPFLNCLLDNLVIHIRKIGYIIDLISLMLHIPPYCVKHNHRTCISNMNQIVNGRTAYIHLNLPLLKRNKFFFSL